ncbi:MAG: hypothetical protein ACRCUI_05750 [Polymorphobacter sp.]
MLTAGDDYPIHQLPTPVAIAGSDRNFYDRYFFNGYAPDGSLFFAGAMGIYPHLNIIDAAFSVTDGVTQRSMFASRNLGHERMDTRVGPISVAIEHPLHRLRLSVADNASGISADLVFTGRAPPIEEPRFTRMNGARTLMDITRLTQNGSYTGRLTLDGKAHDVRGWMGTRDRSWGVRPIGAPDTQPMLPPVPFQFYWLWAPLNFDGYALFFHSNDDASGAPWNRSAVLVPLDGAAPVHLSAPASTLVFKPGTRHAASARLTGMTPAGPISVDLAVERTFFMNGLGYTHPTRGHGMYQGEDALAFETLDVSPATEASMANNHIQALVAATLTLPDGRSVAGRGVLEQMFIGPHVPSGFTDIFDLA